MIVFLRTQGHALQLFDLQFQKGIALSQVFMLIAQPGNNHREMKHDQEKEGEGNQDDCGEIKYSRNLNKKLGEKKSGPEAENQDGDPGEEPQDSVFFPQPFLPDQLKGNNQ